MQLNLHDRDEYSHRCCVVQLTVTILIFSSHWSCDPWHDVLSYLLPPFSLREVKTPSVSFAAEWQVLCNLPTTRCVHSKSFHLNMLLTHVIICTVLHTKTCTNINVYMLNYNTISEKRCRWGSEKVLTLSPEVVLLFKSRGHRAV